MENVRFKNKPNIDTKMFKFNKKDIETASGDPQNVSQLALS